MDSEANRAMSVNDAGHDYELHNMEEGVQNIRFIKKEGDGEGNLKTVHDGTTNEAVLQVLIHRMKVLQEKMPSEHNEKAIAHLEGALAELEARTADRKVREVEGTNQA